MSKEEIKAELEALVAAQKGRKKMADSAFWHYKELSKVEWEAAARIRLLKTQLDA